MSVDLQDAAYRSHVVLNCKMDTDGIHKDFVDNLSAETTKLRVFSAISDKKGLSIRRGEILWTFRDTRYLRPNPHQQPFVRSALNGALIKRDPGSGIVGVFAKASVNCVHKRIAMRSFLKKIQVVGLSNKDIHFDGVIGNDPKDHPVAVISGLMTTRNTGDAFIQAGQFIVADLPDPFSMQMLSAAEKPSTRFGSTIPQEALTIQDRKVLATKPLHKLNLNIPYLFLKETCSLIAVLSQFFDRYTVDLGATQAIENAWAAAFLEYARDTNEQAPDVDQDKRRIQQIKIMQKKLGETVDGPLVTDLLQRYGNLNNRVRDAKAKVQRLEESGLFEIDRMFMESLSQKSKVFKEAQDVITNQIREEVNSQLSNVIGVATTDARPGFSFDIMILPSPTF